MIGVPAGGGARLGACVCSPVVWFGSGARDHRTTVAATPWTSLDAGARIAARGGKTPVAAVRTTEAMP